MKPEAVIFDWDQTLWDSWELHESAIHHAASQAGLDTPSSESIANSLGLTLEVSLSRLFGHSSKEILSSYLEFCDKNWLLSGRLFPGVRSMLESLKSAGYGLALFSNKERWAALREIEQSGLNGSFHQMVFRDEVGKAKPEPDGLLHLLTTLKTPAPQALYVGDHPADMLCARRAGVGPVAALWGCETPEAVLAAKPAIIWQTPEEAVAYLLR